MKPMLAAATDGKDLLYPVLVSPKLDGIRCIVQDGVALSRSLKPIPNRYVQNLIGRTSLNGLDGELIVGADRGPGVFARSSSGIMTIEGEPDFRFHVFDDQATPLSDPFKYRFESATKRCKNVKHRLIPVPHIIIANERALLKHEAIYLAEGYEGIMIRSVNGPYKYGRSTLKEGYLLKLKRFIDSEAVVIGMTQLMHNANEAETNELGYKERSSKKGGKVPLELMGALQVRDLKTKVEFEIGTGFDLDQRRLLWLHGKKVNGRIAKYKSQPVGVKDKPRFPVFLGWRDERDL